VAGTASGRVIVWEVLASAVRLERKFDPPGSSDINSLSWSADRQWIAAGLASGAIEVFDLDGSRQPGTGGTNWPTKVVAFSPDSRKQIAATHEYGAISVIDLDKGTQRYLRTRGVRRARSTDRLSEQFLLKVATGFELCNTQASIELERITVFTSRLYGAVCTLETVVTKRCKSFLRNEKQLAANQCDELF
jgi:WD40 repeat protein